MKMDGNQKVRKASKLRILLNEVKMKRELKHHVSRVGGWWEILGLIRVLMFLTFGYHIATIACYVHGSHLDASSPHRI